MSDEHFREIINLIKAILVYCFIVTITLETEIHFFCFSAKTSDTLYIDIPTGFDRTTY